MAPRFLVFCMAGVALAATLCLGGVAVIERALLHPGLSKKLVLNPLPLLISPLAMATVTMTSVRKLVLKAVRSRRALINEILMFVV